MKKLILLVMIPLFSCDSEELEEPTKTPCEEALDYIESCVGYRPYILNCESVAQRVLNTPCNNLETLWK